jgi:hypothetical protein
MPLGKALGIFFIFLTGGVRLLLLAEVCPFLIFCFLSVTLLLEQWLAYADKDCVLTAVLTGLMERGLV